MTQPRGPLVCELHAHTTWSDGVLTPAELVDLYAACGFGVLAITDHVLRDASGCVHADNHAAYLEAVEQEATRAWRQHGLLVIPGVELTYDDPDPLQAAHVVALGLRVFVGLDGGLEPALAAARDAGATLIAAHPYAVDDADGAIRSTARFAHAGPDLWGLVDRFEVFNRDELFPWVAAAGLPFVANGDFHEPAHVSTWKTALPCARDEEAVLAYLRSTRPAFLTRAARLHAASLAA